MRYVIDEDRKAAALPRRFPCHSDYVVAYDAVSSTPRSSIDLIVQWLVAGASATSGALSLLTRVS